MTKDQKNEVIELLKGKFSQYNNFYVADTESLTVAQVGKLRRACFSKCTGLSKNLVHQLPGIPWIELIALFRY